VIVWEKQSYDISPLLESHEFAFDNFLVAPIAHLPGSLLTKLNWERGAPAQSTWPY